MNEEVFTSSGIYRWPFVTDIDVPTKSELQQNKNPELQLDQHVTAWTASWVNGNHWAYFHGHYLFLHEA
jgi:hypothetical protein